MAGVKQPDDKSHFILPDLGEGVHEAELIKWRVQVGDTVKEHQTMAEMETDKALVEVPSPWNGVIGELCGNAGDIILVGSVLVRYASKGAAVTSAPKTVSAPAKQHSAPVAAVKAEPKPEANEEPQLQQSGSAMRPRVLPSPSELSKQQRELHELTHLPYRRWCSVCVQAKGKHSPHPAVQNRKALIKINFAFMSTKEQPGSAATIFTGINVRTQMAMAVLVPSKTVNRFG